jgi:Phosphotransferase enzyme family
MKDLVPCEILTADLSEHPAARAWSTLQGQLVAPTEIQTLKRKNKSAVYRLLGAGPQGSNVIAKRCLAESAAAERLIYERFLICLPLLSLRLYGFVEEEGSGFQWLFLEDAGTQPYRAEQREHGALLAEWLATLHASTQELWAVHLLPDRGPAHFLEHLRLARCQIERCSGNPALTADDRVLLHGIVSQCDRIEARWDRIERFGEGMPRALVHGDLKEKNLRVRSREQGLSLLCFDWETAGRGIPAPDLFKCPDLNNYLRVAQKTWPWLEADEVQRMCELGSLFRTLAETHWESSHLDFQWLERPRLTLNDCRARLIRASRNLALN